MKSFEAISFDAARCASELAELKDLLAGNATIPERKVIKPFFAQRKQLSTFVGTNLSRVSNDLLAMEWQVFGDFAADIVVGNRATRAFCMVEFENGTPDSIFTSHSARSTKDWGRSFERGFSQLVDWFFALDDFSHTRAFADDFGPGHVRFYGLLVIGRSAGLSDADRRRLRWREERVIVNSHPIHCVTYDELHEELRQRLVIYPAAATGT